MKYPYGISDFKKINTKNYFYCDRTDKIPLLEKSDSQLFIRPRRFGKSLVLSMLENYYDVAKKDEFEAIFGGLKIGRNPTESRNSYFILRLDFSCVDPTGSAENVKRALFNHINVRIDGFYKFYNYKGFEIPNIEINRDDALYSIDSLVASIRMTPYPVYLLIDEYDNFANTVMMGVQSTEKRYEALVHDEGPLRTFFKSVKASTSGSMFDRVFITGVSPVVMSDITSGYNIAKDIYFEPEFNDLCGFKQNEIEDVLEKIVDKCGFEADKSVNVKSEPWSSLFESNNPAFQIFYLDKLLNALEEKNPEHPLIFVFQPYLRQDKIELERVASKYYSKIQECGLPENIINSLCDVFVSWMMICFEKLSYKEVLKMMSLTTPLEDTVAYKELVAIGEKIGERKGEKIGERKGIRESIINVLEVRFGNISPEVIDRVNQFDDLQELKELHRRAILLKEMDDTVFSFS